LNMLIYLRDSFNMQHIQPMELNRG